MKALAVKRIISLFFQFRSVEDGPSRNHCVAHANFRIVATNSSKGFHLERNFLERLDSKETRKFNFDRTTVGRIRME